MLGSDSIPTLLSGILSHEIRMVSNFFLDSTMDSISAFYKYGNMNMPMYSLSSLST